MILSKELVWNRPLKIRGLFIITALRTCDAFYKTLGRFSYNNNTYLLNQIVFRMGQDYRTTIVSINNEPPPFGWCYFLYEGFTYKLILKEWTT